MAARKGRDKILSIPLRIVDGRKNEREIAEKFWEKKKKKKGTSLFILFLFWGYCEGVRAWKGLEGLGRA